MTNILTATTHRVYPPPTTPWIMAQTWRDLLFAHWPVAPDALRPLIPAGLTLDPFDGQGWVGVVPFLMRGVRPRITPSFPPISNFLELNVRTYVTAGGRPGVLFFCLDASNAVAVAIARGTFALPYYNARMAATDFGDHITYTSTRTDTRGNPAAFDATYGPIGDVLLSKRGTLEAFLTERYALYTRNAHGHVMRGEIHHRQWPLQPAEAVFRTNTMAHAHSISLPDSTPILHFARRLDVVVWLPTRVARTASV